MGRNGQNELQKYKYFWNEKGKILFFPAFLVVRAGQLAKVAALCVSTGLHIRRQGTRVVGGVVGGATGDVNTELKIEN